MNIKSVTTEATVATREQVDLSPKGKGEATVARAAAVREQEKDVVVSLQELVKKEEVTKAEEEAKPAESELFNLKAFFAVDDEENVVIRFVDHEGKTVKQFPPEEYLAMAKKFKANVESLFHAEA